MYNVYTYVYIWSSNSIYIFFSTTIVDIQLHTLCTFTYEYFCTMAYILVIDQTRFTLYNQSLRFTFKSRIWSAYKWQCRTAIPRTYFFVKLFSLISFVQFCDFCTLCICWIKYFSLILIIILCALISFLGLP